MGAPTSERSLSAIEVVLSCVSCREDIPAIHEEILAVRPVCDCCGRPVLIVVLPVGVQS